MSPADDVVFQQWVIRGDVEAFQTIVQRHAQMVYATCRRILRNPTEAEDVTQECFEALVEATGTSRVKALAPWLHGMATKRSLMRIRSEGRRKQRETTYVTEQPSSAAVQWNDIYSYVDEAVAELSDELREPTVAHFFFGQTHGEIARETGIPRRTVSKRIERAVARVGESLRKRGVGVTAATLSSLLLTNLAEAAPLPLPLNTTLGKLALSQTGITATGGPASVAASAIMLKKALMIFAVVATVGMAFWGIQQMGQQETPQQAARVFTEDTPAEPVTSKPAPEPAEPDTVAAAPETPTDAETVAVVQTGTDEATVSGRVVDAAGNPVAEATVHARTTPMSFASADPHMGTGTDTDGHFTILGLKPSYNLYLQAQHYQVEQTVIEVMRTSVVSAPAGPFELTKQGLTGLELVVHPSGSIHGQLIDAQGRPVSGVQIGASSRTADVHYPYGSETDAGGAFEIAACAADTYLICAYPPGAASVGHDTALAEVTLAPGEHRRGLRLVYSPYVRLAGRVINEAGEAVAQAEVLALYHGDHAKTDGDGMFELLLHSSKPLDFRVRHLEYFDLREKPVGELEDLELQLQRRGVVAGRVVDAQSRKPITDFEVMHLGGRVNPVELRRFFNRFEGVHDGDGRFDIRPSRPGSPTICVRAEGYVLKAQYLEEHELGEEIVVALERGHPLEGTVRNPSGDAVRGAKIYLGTFPYGYELEQDEEVLAAKTDSFGRFTVDSAPPDELLVFAWHPDYPPAWKRIRVSQNDAVDIVFPESGTLRGTVTIGGKGAQAVANISYRTPRLTAFFVHARPDGSYRLKNLAPGAITVRGKAHDPETNTELARTQPAVIRPGEVTEVNFDFPVSSESTIAGYISVDGEAPDNAQVRAVLADGSSLLTRADSEGYYHVPYLTEGEVKLIVSASVGDLRFHGRAVVEVEPNVDITHDINLKPGTTVVARVTGARSGEEVRVVLYPGLLDHPPSPREVAADRLLRHSWHRTGGILSPDSSITIKNAQPGPYTAVAQASSGVATSEEEALANTRYAITHVNVKGEEDIAIDLRLP